MKQKVDSLPEDVQDVVIKDAMVIVHLTNGKIGVANCGTMDTFDPYVGFTIAYYKAKNIKNFKLKNILNSCVNSAIQKGYKQTILKNYASKREHKVEILQRALKTLGYRVKVTGKFDKQTKDGVIEFQRKMGITPTGDFNKETKNKMAMQGYQQGGVISMPTIMI